MVEVQGAPQGPFFDGPGCHEIVVEGTVRARVRADPPVSEGSAIPVRRRSQIVFLAEHFLVECSPVVEVVQVDGSRID